MRLDKFTTSVCRSRENVSPRRLNLPDRWRDSTRYCDKHWTSGMTTDTRKWAAIVISLSLFLGVGGKSERERELDKADATNNASATDAIAITVVNPLIVPGSVLRGKPRACFSGRESASPSGRAAFFLRRERKETVNASRCVAHWRNFPLARSRIYSLRVNGMLSRASSRIADRDSNVRVGERKQRNRFSTAIDFSSFLCHFVSSLGSITRSRNLRDFRGRRYPRSTAIRSPFRCVSVLGDTLMQPAMSL